VSFYDGKHALVTGGGSGIGKAVARVLRDKGATVTITGRNRARLAATAGELDVSWQLADVTDRQAVADAFAAAGKRNGRIDILVNNAGVAEAMPFSRMEGELWDRLLSINLTGVYNCTRAVIDGMLAAGSGRIVNVASIAALKGAAYVAAYSAAKHGVIGLTRALAAEYAQKDITVNAVCPGYTDTEMVQKAIDNIASKTERTREEALAELVKTNPQGRLISPAEVADAVVWLCRQPSMTGQSIVIAGGELT
jgi:NAD(P)-dependent dehydrogenase (short-subunit alcohol dehydrogenase family)